MALDKRAGERRGAEHLGGALVVGLPCTLLPLDALTRPSTFYTRDDFVDIKNAGLR